MKNRCGSSLIAAALLVIGASAAQATPQLIKSPLPHGHSRTQEAVYPLGPEAMTQNVDPNTIIWGASTACAGGGLTTDTGYLRLYDLDDDEDFVGQFCTTSMDYGIEQAIGPQSITANVYCLDEGLPFLKAFMVLTGTATQPQPDALLEFFQIAVDGCCDASTQDMVVELLSEDCVESLGICKVLILGANNLGQTAPSYIVAPDCGFVEPTDLALWGYPDAHIIQFVIGNVENDGPCQGGDCCNCCFGGFVVGCDCPACQDVVCGIDPSCCNINWDKSCNELASTSCTCCPSQVPGTCSAGDGGGVPAATGPGAVIIVLALLATSALLLRRSS